MSNLSGEQILGIHPDFSPKSLSPIVQRVLDIENLRPADNRYNAEFNQAREKLTEDSIAILAEAAKLPPKERIDFAMKFIPLVDWRYTWDTSSDSAKRNQEMSLLRQTGLKVFLMDIPTETLNDRTINTLFKIANANKPNQYRNLTGLRHFLVSSISKMPYERGKKFIDYLNPYTGYDSKPEIDEYADQVGMSEQAFAMRNWTVEEALPIVNRMIDSDLQTHSDHLKAIAEAIINWPQQNQEDIIRKSLGKTGINGYYEKHLFRIMKNWEPEQSKPLLEELLAAPLKEVFYWDRKYGSLAEAMSNWSQEELDAFLTNENNTRFLRDVARYDEQKYRDDIEYQHSYEEKYSRVLNEFHVAILSERDGNFTEEMTHWLEDSIRYHEGQKSLTAGRVILKHITLFPPEITSALILSRSEGTILDTIDTISELPKNEQLRLLKPLADLYMTDSLGQSYNEAFKYKVPVSRAFNKIILGWELGEVDNLVSELLSRGLVSKKQFNPFANESSRASNIENAFRLLSYHDQITDPWFVKQILTYEIGYPESDAGKRAAEIVGKIVWNEETEKIVIEAAGDAIAGQFLSLSQESVKRALQIGEKYHQVEVAKFQQKLPVYLQSVITAFNKKDINDLSYFISENFDYMQRLSTTPDQPTVLTNEDVNKIPGLHLSVLESEAVKKSGINLQTIETEEDYRKVFEVLCKEVKGWQDEQNIINPFRKGAEVFGYQRIFAYLDRRNITEPYIGFQYQLDLSRHDGLHTFENILELYQKSDLLPDQFYGQILSHVMRDNAVYSAGTAQHELNEIASTIDTDFTKNLTLAKEFADIEGIGELAEMFSTPDQIFASWNNLKRYSKLTQLLGQREVLESLQMIDNQALRKYVAHLAFHKDSKVNMQAAIQFATDPMSFLEREDDHAPGRVHSHKKPSNYIEIPNLDLTAQELVEALVDEKMDALSAFTPMEISYSVIVDGTASRPQELLKRALGSSAKEGVIAVPGEARDSKKLFSEVNRLLKPTGLTVQQYLAGDVLPDAFRDEVEQQLFSSLLFSDQFGMRKASVRTQTYVAKIGRKSDPDMVLAGDDTVNCMPFGSGKNTVYTFNPNTAQFVLQVVRPDGKRRTIAQSVLTKDIDIKQSIPTVIGRLQEEGGHLVDVVPEDALLRQSALIACDNVEVAPNFTDQARVITALYRDFFREYLNRFAKQQNLQSTHVIVGEGYSDALNELPEIPNTFAPQAPVSYSDATGVNVRTLNLDQSDPYAILERTVMVDDLPKAVQTTIPGIDGLELLTFEHALQVAYIEGKAYADNTSLMQYLHNMENGLIAKDINNADKGRQNMSLAYRDKTGKMQGYMLAYEGKLSESDAGDYAHEYENQPVLYIADTAVADKSAFAGAKAGAALVQGFADLYKQNYVDKGNLIPIFTQAREETSFRLIKRKFDELSKEAGIQFDLEELPTYQSGSSTMHPVIIKPKK